MLDKTKNKLNTEALKPYLEFGWKLLPLHKPLATSTDKRGRKRKDGKRPLHGAWAAKTYNSQSVVKQYGGTHNIGVQLRDEDCVIDVDTRRNGEAGLAKLERDFNLNFANAPRVITGSSPGGSHIYLKIPKGVKLVDTLEKYEGVEFKSKGRQVVAAGSIHPDTGNLYEWDAFGGSLEDAPECPANLLEAITRPEAPSDQGEAGDVAPDQLAEMLAELDPCDFQDQDKWRELLFSCHHATAGEARAEFIEWSIGDPKYAGDADIIGRRWDSLHTERGGDSVVTKGTLFKILQDAGHGDKVPARDASADFDGDEIDEAHEDAAPNRDGFKVRDGKVVATSQGNIKLALRKLGVRVRYDSFADRYLIEGLKGFGPYLDDAAMNHLRLTMDENFKFLVPKELFFDVVFDIARHRSFHPVRDHLDALEWDGEERIATWLIRNAGAYDTPYVRAVSELVLIAAVRRIRKPGSKFDEMMVLESSQGTDKSSALAIMAVKAEWFTDAFPLNADDKRVIEALAGKWIVEAAELKGMRRGEIESIKSMLSRQVDRARMSYGRTPIERPRQCVIVGTTNSDTYLRDTTGNRRFWPIKVGRFDLSALKAERDQLWAEAAAREAEGVSIRLDRELWSEAAKVQKLRTVTDPFTDTFRAILGKMEGKILSEDAWRVLGIPAGHRTQDHNARFGSALSELGWKRKRRRFKGKPAHCYVRGSEPLRLIRVDVGSGPRPEVSAYHAEECSDD